MACRDCGKPLRRSLGIVKDGALYEAYRCPEGHYALVEMHLDHLPVELALDRGVHAATMLSGTNWYIFDRRLFRGALRRVLRAVRERPGDLVLDLSRISFIGEALLGAVRFVDAGLRRRGHELRVISSSRLVQSEILAAAPGLEGRVLTRLEDAYAPAAAEGFVTGAEL